MTKPALRTDADFDAFYERNWKYVYRLCFTFVANRIQPETDQWDMSFLDILTIVAGLLPVQH